MTHAYDSFLVAAIAKFRDEQDCMDFLNQARVGLAGYFFSRDPGQIWRVAEAMEVSTGNGPEVNYLTGSNIVFRSVWSAVTQVCYHAVKHHSVATKNLVWDVKDL